MSHRLCGHPVRRSLPRCTSARSVPVSSHAHSLFTDSRPVSLLLKFKPIPPKSSMSDALTPRRTSDAASTSLLIPAPRRPTTASPPSSPILPQLTSRPSPPGDRPTPSPGSPKEKTRRPRWQRWFALPQRNTTYALRALKSGILAVKVASLCFNNGALPLWALSMLAGLSIVDSLSDNGALNLGLGVMHVAVLKAFTWWG